MPAAAEKLTPADPNDLAEAIAFALNSGRKRVHDSDKFAVKIAADRRSYFRECIGSSRSLWPRSFAGSSSRRPASTVPQEVVRGPCQVRDEPKRVLRSGGTFRGDLERLSGSRRRRRSASTLSGIPVPTRPI